MAWIITSTVILWMASAIVFYLLGEKMGRSDIRSRVVPPLEDRARQRDGYRDVLRAIANPKDSACPEDDPRVMARAALKALEMRS